MSKQDNITCGPIILWQDYGCEGWKPTSFDTIKEALEYNKYQSNWKITRTVSFDVIEKE